MSRTPTFATLGADVYAGIRRGILTGHFPPGSRLKAAELREQFGGVSLSVVREALSRLAAQRLVVARHNQGFSVAEITAKGIRDLTDVRVMMEGRALTMSIERGDTTWESRVVAAHHVLKRATPSAVSAGVQGTTEEWSQAHHTFHRALISACDVPILIEVCDSLFDGSELYRQVGTRGAGSRRDVAREHEELMEYAVARDVPRATALFEQHLSRTTEIVLRGLAASAPADDVLSA